MNNGKSVKIGEKYDKLTVIAITNKRDTRGNIIVTCRCSCNNIIDKSSILLKTRKTSSCGCARYNEPGQASWALHIYTYKTNAKKRNINFNLKMEEFKEICKKDCFYCGAMPRAFNKYEQGTKKLQKHLSYRNWIFVNGIDRLNNENFYSIENTVPCCQRCNEGKMALSLNEFDNWITKVYNRRTKDVNK